jgi:glycerol-3-phosphate dehydrogenase
VIEDVDATVRELRSVTPPAASKQISTFFTVVSGKWLRLRQAQEAAAAASALAAKDKGGKKPRRTSVLGGGNDAAAAEEDKPEASDSALQLVAVGPSMQRAEAVRWDFARNQCAILQTGSSAVTIMRLHTPAVTQEDNGYALLSLQALCSVDVCRPTSLRPPVCGLTWSDGLLFTASSGASSMQLTFFSSPTATTTNASLFADTFALPNCSPVRLHVY